MCIRDSANSDSVSDQALKMRVKESVVNYIYEKTGDFKTVDEAKNFILNNDKTIKSIATKAIADNGYDYTVSSTFGFSDFPVKTYGCLLYTSPFESLSVSLAYPDETGLNL